eukprot:768537-Hanusia_phi.AAC.3
MKLEGKQQRGRKSLLISTFKYVASNMTGDYKLYIDLFAFSSESKNFSRDQRPAPPRGCLLVPPPCPNDVLG